MNHDKLKMKNILRRFLNREPTESEIVTFPGNTHLMSEYTLEMLGEILVRIADIEKKVKDIEDKVKIK